MNVRRRRTVTAVALLLAGYAALIAAWTMANPLGRAPDEPAHYIRALAAGTGDTRGEPVSTAPSAFPPLMARWVVQITRSFALPSRLAIDQTSPCPIDNPTVPAACQRQWPTPGADRQPTNVGSYQPYVYMAIGTVMRTAPTRWTAFVFGRAAVGAGALGLLALAGVSLCEGNGGVAVLGLLAAVTPMAVFLAGTLNPSGVEVAAGVACAAGLLSLARQSGGPRPPRWAWVTFGVGGTVLAITRSLGPYFVATLMALTVLLIGVGRARQLVRDAPRPAAVSIGCVADAALVNLWWEANFQPHLAWTRGLDHATLAKIPRFGQELVGKFGWLEWHLPWPFY
ncbi:MAG: DUF2142 domain-containing protein, partial [Acidimicrobiia bacterium]|nr:DUF2142 domain-containing protein [Acidimicrobiia bacterium]